MDAAYKFTLFNVIKFYDLLRMQDNFFLSVMFKKFLLKGKSILLPLLPPRQNLLCCNYIIGSDIMYYYYI